MRFGEVGERGKHEANHGKKRLTLTLEGREPGRHLSCLLTLLEVVSPIL